VTKPVKIKPMTPGVPPAARNRAYAAGIVVTLGLVGVGYKAWALQVDDGAKYRALAERQHAMRLDIPAPRGEVTDVHGRPLAVTADADSIWANPREVHDLTGTADKLAKLIAGDASILESKLAGNRRFVWLDRHVSPEVAAAVRAAKLPGIEVAREPRRWYPAKSIAGPVIGRADIDGNGVDGIELSMNDMLKGKHGAVAALRDARGRRMLSDGLAADQAGNTVKLTIDRSIQAITDEALATAITTHQAKNGVAVVLDVATSHVLAMSSFPTYDPNSGGDHGARNRPVTDAYESGSVMKVFTVAAALEDGAVTPTTTFTIGGAFKVGAKTFRDTHVYPTLNTAEIIKVSSNIGATKIAMRLGREKLYSYLKKFGFGGTSGIELPGEQTGKIRDGSTWRDVELATISFGYGLTITPLQLAAGMAAIGNNGLYTEPRIVDLVTSPDGAVLYKGQGATRQMVNPRHAAAIRTMLASVFEKGVGPHGLNGTAGSIVVPGFKCGGKTGTAHKYDHALRGYSPNRYLGSFAGLAPIDNPRLAIIVMIDEPSGKEHYGGSVAAPAFAEIASQSLRYLGVPGEAIIPRDARGKPIVTPPRAGPDVAARRLPIAGTADDDTAELDTPEEPVVDEMLAPGTILIPDFRGMGVGRALDEARKVRLELDVIGTGQVISQAPAPGRATGATRVKLTFSDDARRTSLPLSAPTSAR
jgi:cell division protein FtsI (penicillin-binding protein 3)